VRKFRRLDEISRFFHIVLTTNLLSDVPRPIFFIPTHCASGLHIVLDADPSVGAVQWSVSRDIHVNVNGRSVPAGGIAPFGDLLARVALDAMFVAMRRDVVRAAVDYATHPSSAEFAVRAGGEALAFSQTDRAVDPASVCPPFVPCLARAMLGPGPRPYDRLRGLLEAWRDIRAAERIICAAFIACDFCTVAVSRRRAEAAFQLRPLQGQAAVALVAGGRVVASDPHRPMGRIVIECDDRLRDALARWCRAQYWRMFVAAAAAVAAHFGFAPSATQTDLAVECGAGRAVEFRSSPADMGEIVVIVTEAAERLRIRWNAIPLVGHFQRLSYLFFFPIFKH
jgi:hypothetical protein